MWDDDGDYDDDDERKKEGETRFRIIACSSRKTSRGPAGLTSPSDGRIAMNILLNKYILNLSPTLDRIEGWDAMKPLFLLKVCGFGLEHLVPIYPIFNFPIECKCWTMVEWSQFITFASCSIARKEGISELSLNSGYDSPHWFYLRYEYFAKLHRRICGGLFSK